MGICAYCDRDRKLTREELFPSFLIRGALPGANIDHTRPSKPHEAITVIRDVCATCNNEVLGSLDAYGAELSRNYFNRILMERPVWSEFVCDTELLLRWLLKLLFNDARASKGALPDRYLSLRRFILGQDPASPFGLEVLLGLIEPFSPPGSSEILDPEGHFGFSEFTFQHPEADRVAWFRGVFINSYLLSVLAWNANAVRPARKRILTDMQQRLSLHRLARPQCNTRVEGACMSTRHLIEASVRGTFALA
jgi:hypothetical protein